jgi:hypothetical protein
LHVWVLKLQCELLPHCSTHPISAKSPRNM